MSCFITSTFNLSAQKSVNMPVYNGFITNSTSVFPKIPCKVICRRCELCIMSTASAQSRKKPADHATKMTKRRP